MLIIYSEGAVELPELPDLLQDGGTILIKTVEERKKGQSEKALVYGFFLKHSDGTVYDILNKGRTGLKTFANVDRAFEFLVKYMPNSRSFTIPVLCAENIVRPGFLKT